MQSDSEATSGFGWKSSVVRTNVSSKGKENELNGPMCLQPGVQKPTVEKLVPHDTPKSRLPILSKIKEPPDFKKLHQSWQNQFHKGKALKKKSCTRPQPFNFSQKGDQSQVTINTGRCVNPQAGLGRREPLAEFALGQKNEEFKAADVKGVSEEFKSDPAALASILSNVGVPVVSSGKFSLAQRVPMRVSSIAQSSNICKKPIIRSSMYAVLRSQSASSNLDRMSCFSKMHTKEHFPRSTVEHPGGQKPLFEQNLLLKGHAPDGSVKELVVSNMEDKLQSQENPVLQQMNQAAYIMKASSVISTPLGSQKVTTVKSTPFTEDDQSSTLLADKCEKNLSEVDSCVGKLDAIKKAGSASVDFVADVQALASILSNTGVTSGNFGKFSLAQRVPVQGRSVKSGMTSLGHSAVQATAPKPYFGRMSTRAVPNKDIAFSPCRVPKPLMPDKSSSGSAKRIHQANFSASKFSQPYSATSKPPFFPKTPRALALEMANKKLASDSSCTQPSARSMVKWADELSSSTLCENEPKMEQVAMRLFLDGEYPAETDEKEETPAESDDFRASEDLTSSVQKGKEATLPENSADSTAVAAPAGLSQDLSVHTNMHPPAAVSLPSTTDHPRQYPSIMSCMKTSLPRCFLSHPVVQTLQTRTFAPSSLPDIARLRIQAAVSAKQRFWETCLDEECAFYTSREAIRSCRKCIDPVSSFLDRQEDLHFRPIIPGEP